MLENYMQAYFPEIQIIGEEDTTKEFIKESEFFSVEKEENINFNLIREGDIPDNLNYIDPNELCLYIDPIDSTEQFLKKNYAPVTSLVGLSLNSEAFIGFIYFPSYQGKDKQLTYFNIPTKGIFVYDTKTGDVQNVSIEKQDLSLWTFISSGTRTTSTMRDVFKLFDNSKTIQIHGLGNKALEVVLQDYLFLSSGPELGLWDVCAGHCLAKEVGGGLFYLDGTEVRYPNDKTSRTLTKTTFMSKSIIRAQKFVEIYKSGGIESELI